MFRNQKEKEKKTKQTAIIKNQRKMCNKREKGRKEEGEEERQTS